MKKTIKLLTCKKCGIEFLGKHSKYCDECRKKIRSEIMYNTNQKSNIERMKNNNPMFDLETKQKMINTLKKLKIKPPIRGGNGRPTPAPVLYFCDKISIFNPILEYVIPTKCPKKEHLYPTCYKVDIAIPEIKYAFEIDGKSHNLLIRKQQDAKKDQLLKSLGWNVIRIKNKDVYNFDYGELIDAIKRLSNKSN